VLKIFDISYTTNICGGIIIYKVLKAYPFYKDIVKVEKYGNGHINNTYIVETNREKYIVQEINTSVFLKPKKVMKNIKLITKYIKNNNGKSLELVNNNRGKCLIKCGNCYFRCYRFIEEGITYENTSNTDIFYEVGRAIGEFQNQLIDYPINKIKITIPNFHDTWFRYKKLFSLINNNDRVSDCVNEIRFVSSRKIDIINYMSALEKLPLRIVHNDTKLNNVMFDKKTNKAICMIDLDTVMPGYLLFDYADALRIGASSASEDEIDTSNVYYNEELFESFTSGYLKEVKNIITNDEKDLLYESVRMMSLECGIRFLTDFLENDIYFKTKYKNHNLVRAKNQFKLVEDLEKRSGIFLELIKNCIDSVDAV